MRLHRFIGPFDLSRETLTVSDAKLINQWRNVLRLKIGDQIVLSDGHGAETEATIIDSAKGEIRLSLQNTSLPAREPKKHVTLYCALLKRENFELVAQKATEVGVSRIVPILSERTVKVGWKRERIERILIEASEQSGRTTVPDLSEPMTLGDILREVNPKETTFFDLGGTPFKDLAMKDFITFNLLIGPEGGFSESEAETARKAGCAIASLGSLTLRAETAAIVACYLACQ